MSMPHGPSKRQIATHGLLRVRRRAAPARSSVSRRIAALCAQRETLAIVRAAEDAPGRTCKHAPYSQPYSIAHWTNHRPYESGKFCLEAIRVLQKQAVTALLKNDQTAVADSF